MVSCELRAARGWIQFTQDLRELANEALARCGPQCCLASLPGADEVSICVCVLGEGAMVCSNGPCQAPRDVFIETGVLQCRRSPGNRHGPVIACFMRRVEIEIVFW
ncbi:MAG: hypothetical protein MJD61_09485 [Proteobacteria bacterium]|nr:hypothetical protein [Pseudomonadota bacterium]